MKYNIILFFLLLNNINLLSQNLIRNGDFEIANKDSVLFAWESIAGTSDYININKPNVRKQLIEKFKNDFKKNEGCMGICISQTSSEVFQQKLNHKLEKEALYELSCYVLAGMQCPTGLDNITISLSPTELDQSEYPISYKNKIPYVFKLTTKEQSIKHGEWVKVKVIFKANGREQFIAVGNFNAENIKYIKSAKYKMEHGSGHSCDYLYFDNITLKKISKSDLAKTSQKKDKLQRKIILDDLFFESGKSELSPNYQSKLDSIFSTIDKSNYRVKITGYTDNIGTIEANKILSLQRAETIKSYLVSKGYNENHISTEGLHETNPIMSNDTEYGRSQNRRVEIILSPL